MFNSELKKDHQTDSQILHPSTRALYRYWEGLRAERAAPNHDEVNLKDLLSYVPDLVILEHSSSRNTYVWRLAGTRVCQLYGRELTGSDVLSGWDGFERRTLNELFDNVITALQPCVVKARLTTSCSQTIGIEMIGLPLFARNNSRIHIFGAIFPFRSLHEITADPVIAQELSAARTIWTEHLPGDKLVASLNQQSQRPFRVITGGRS